MRAGQVLLVRAAVRSELRSKGYTLVEAIRLSREVDEDTLNVALSNAPKTVQSKLADAEKKDFGAIGDGTLLKFFTEFLKSELGQQLIAIILKLLIPV